MKMFYSRTFSYIGQSKIMCCSINNYNDYVLQPNDVWLVILVLRVLNRGVETLSQLLDILTYFHHSCPAPHILCIQLSCNLPDIH